MPYYLTNEFLLDNPWITVVGCGGTGGFVAEGLCRLFQGRDATIVLVDHDRVEPHNLLRQNFYAGRTWAASRARPWPTGSPKPTTGPWATRSIPSEEEVLRPDWQATLSRPLLPRRTGHRLRRQRRRPAGHGRVSAGRPLPLAHRRRQRH